MFELQIELYVLFLTILTFLIMTISTIWLRLAYVVLDRLRLFLLSFVDWSLLVILIRATAKQSLSSKHIAKLLTIQVRLRIHLCIIAHFQASNFIPTLLEWFIGIVVPFSGSLMTLITATVELLGGVNGVEERSLAWTWGQSVELGVAHCKQINRWLSIERSLSSIWWRHRRWYMLLRGVSSHSFPAYAAGSIVTSFLAWVIHHEIVWARRWRVIVQFDVQGGNPRALLLW